MIDETSTVLGIYRTGTCFWLRAKVMIFEDVRNSTVRFTALISAETDFPALNTPDP